MIVEKSRADLGFPDDWGYVYLRDSMPLIQLHPCWNSGFTTIFWRGALDRADVTQRWRDLMTEMSAALNYPWHRLRRSTVTVARKETEDRFPWALDPETVEEAVMEREAHAAIASDPRNPAFVRLDAETDIPIILWADLVPGGDVGHLTAEIGFSSVIIPDIIIDLFSLTSHVSIGPTELERLQSLMNRHMQMQMVPQPV